MLAQLRINRELQLREAELRALEEKSAELKTREEGLEQSLTEAVSQEDLDLVDQGIQALGEEQTQHSSETDRVKQEIEKLQRELRDLDSRQREAKQTLRNNREEKGMEALDQKTREYMGNLSVREAYGTLMQREEVREFFSALHDVALNKRAIASADLTIPEVVVNRIRMRMGDYGALYGEVEVLQLNGTARVVMDGEIPEAIWTEMCDTLQELGLGFKAVELDGYKLGGFVPVCNAILEDSFISLAAYVEDRLARAIVKGRDNAILNGTGATGHQPIGIVPSIIDANKVTVTDAADNIPKIMESLGLIDTGEDDVGEIIAVMRRQTYYSQIMPHQILSTAAGTIAAPSINSPYIAGAGLRVVFSQYAPANAVILGEFKKYLLGERMGIQIARSEHVRFIEDQTVFKATARYDGKPIDLDEDGKTASFALITLPAPVTP